MLNHEVIIVTFNRLALLKECVEACLAQELPFDRILIVDNASTDGTEEYLRSISEGTGNNRIHVRRMAENRGGAGGFAEGFRLAMEDGFQWLTVIDDDAILRPDFLQKIQERIDQDKGEIGCYAGVPLTGGIRIGHRRRVEGKIIKREVPVPAEEYRNPVFSCDIASFCGLVVSRSALEAAGIPREDFFIWYDDTEYCLRLRKSTEIRTVTAAVIDHKAPMGGESRPVSWKDYYGIRNRIFMARKYYGLPTAHMIALKKRLKCAGLCLRSTGAERKSIQRLYSQAIRDGFKGRLGKNPTYAP